MNRFDNFLAHCCFVVLLLIVSNQQGFELYAGLEIASRPHCESSAVNHPKTYPLFEKDNEPIDFLEAETAGVLIQISRWRVESGATGSNHRISSTVNCEDGKQNIRR